MKVLSLQEREKIQTWAKATELLANPDDTTDINFLLDIIQNNKTIPVIMMRDDRVSSYLNIDETKAKDTSYLLQKVEFMKSQNEPIVIDYLEQKTLTFFYQDSTTLQRLKTYPYIQLAIISLFLIVSYFAFSYSRTSEQNKVWAGMSKETAHQLGTPISSLIAWMEYAESSKDGLSDKVIQEMKKDIGRLETITDRFSKVGSEPVLSQVSLTQVVENAISYLSSRVSKHVAFSIEDISTVDLVHLNIPLFEWVIENLTKNAVDAMKGKGSISFKISNTSDSVILEVSDTGSGIPSSKFKTIFKPGYTSKKRGWGLGLSLVKRIVENYHEGKIFVSDSRIGKGTTFKIVLANYKENL